MSTLMFVLLAAGLLETLGSQEDYVQWVDYSGKIPNGAFPGGSDADNNLQYVGRAYYATDPLYSETWTVNSTEGYFPGVISPGVESIDIIVYGGPETITEGVQIMVVGKSTQLEWKTVNYFEFPKLFDDPAFHPVRAGYENHGLSYNSTVYLGRVKYQGAHRFGNILTIGFPGEKYWLDYAAEGEFHKADIFDVLVYYY